MLRVDNNMMNNLIIQNNDEFGNVRFVEVNGKPYAVASDVARILGYKNISRDIQRHCKNIRKVIVPQNGTSHSKARKTQEMLVIPEGDIYRLIIRSKLPTAQKFESWLMDEVLPQIRQTGGYNTITKKDRLLLGLFSNDKSIVEECKVALHELK